MRRQIITGIFQGTCKSGIEERREKWNPEEVQKAMESYESFYLGNGWYSDGKRPQKDYYVSFGIHFYCLLYARFMKRRIRNIQNCFENVRRNLPRVLFTGLMMREKHCLLAALSPIALHRRHFFSMCFG